MESAEHLLSKASLDKHPQCPHCGLTYDGSYYSQPVQRHRVRYWTLTVIAHTILLAFSTYAVNRITHPALPTLEKPLKPDGTIDHDKHLVGTPEAPLAYHERLHMKIEHVPAGAWTNPLYFGEPNYDSDWAWINMTNPRTFRLHKDEAARLNFTDSVMVKPGEDFSSMLGVIHNLHCLRRLRQMLYPDYYYPNEAEDMKQHNFGHALHCLEALRSSVMCYPDLNPHPFYWSGMKYHDITVSAKVTRQCVDWEALQERLEPRNFKDTELMRGTGPVS